MKTSTPTYLTMLTASSAWFCADLVTVSGSGFVLRWTTGDTDLVSGSVTFTAANVSIDGLRSSVGTSIDGVDITIAGAALQLSGSGLHLAAANGAFDGASVSLQRALMPAWGDLSSGAPITFEGTVATAEPSAGELRLRTKSRFDLMTQPFPRRLLQPSCPYTFGDSDCGVSLAPYTQTTTVLASPASTTTLINFNGTSGVVNFYRLGVLTVAGVRRSIVASRDVSTYTELTIYPPLASVPVGGTSITVVRGCDKTRATCLNTFSNLARFGGFADMPPMSAKGA